MKVRHGFVSNSSSSSFMCAVCGEIESGYDLSLSDCEMSRCEHGHEFHNSHAELDFFEDGTREGGFVSNKIQNPNIKAIIENFI